MRAGRRSGRDDGVVDDVFLSMRRYDYVDIFRFIVVGCRIERPRNRSTPLQEIAVNA